MLSPERAHALIKPKHEFKMVPDPGSRAKVKMVRVHVGFYEDRDVNGTRIHWEWLLAKWTALANKIEGEEGRGVYGPRNRTEADRA